MKEVKLYPNSCVERIVIGIPRGHMHARMAIELCDQVIVLHEAAVAAMVRAFAAIVLHPRRRALEMKRVKLGKNERKPLYAEHQLLEVEEPEVVALDKLETLLKEAKVVDCGCAEPADADR